MSENDGRRGLTGTLIEGSIGVKHLNSGDIALENRHVVNRLTIEFESKNTVGKKCLRGHNQ